MLEEKGKRRLGDLVRYGFITLLIAIPLSFPVKLGTSQINIPSEPLIAFLAVILTGFVNGKAFFRSRIIRHPLSLLGLIYHGWMIFLIPFSSNPLVSLKYTLVNAAHFWVFYFGFYFFAIQAGKTLRDWFGLYIMAFVAVILYTGYHHAQYDFRMDASLIMALPFYNDHALYGASIALVLPFVLLLPRTYLKKPYSLVLVGVLVIALFISSSRAAWLSLVAGGLFISGLKLFRIKFITLAGLIGCLSLLTLYYHPRLNRMIGSIGEESRKGTWVEHIKSIGNITSDVSNLERLNRYRCALRMWADRPITGFGPGTYQFAYLPYQKPHEMTRLSVTTPHAPDGGPHPTGRGGGAHSEYLQALSELGLPGLLCWLGFLFTSLYTGLKRYYMEKNKEHQYLLLAILFGLVTYFTHAFFNNFLHSEEIAVLFWAALSALAFLDSNHEKSVEMIDQ